MLRLKKKGENTGLQIFFGLNVRRHSAVFKAFELTGINPTGQPAGDISRVIDYLGQKNKNNHCHGGDI